MNFLSTLSNMSKKTNFLKNIVNNLADIFMNTNKLGLIISLFLMVLTMPYTIYAYFDHSIPFDKNLFFFSGIALALFMINYYYYKFRSRD